MRIRIRNPEINPKKQIATANYYYVVKAEYSVLFTESGESDPDQDSITEMDVMRILRN